MTPTSPPPKECPLGGSPKLAFQCWLIAIALAIYAAIALTICALYQEDGVIPVWKSLLLVTGLLSVVGSVLAIFFGICLAFNSLMRGIKLVLDERGVHYHLVFGRVRSCSWDEVKVQLVDRQEQYKKSSGMEIVQIFGVAGKLLDAAMSEYGTITIKGILFDSPKFKIKFEPGDYDFIGLERWLLCRGLGAEITRGGGSVTWDRDGLESINLAGCPITDEQFNYLAALLRRVPELVRIDLTATPLTNAIVPALQELPNLCELEIKGTRISPGVLPRVLKERLVRGPTAEQKPTFDFLK